MNRNISMPPAFSGLSTEDKIRALRQAGANQQSAPVAADVASFASMAGDPQPGMEREYAMGLGDYLTKRGHKVSYTGM